MRYSALLLIIVFFVLSCDKRKDRVCKCTVKESGTTTTTTEIALPFPFPASSDTQTEPYSTETSAIYNFSDVREKDMNAACPKTATEEVNETLTSKSESTVSITMTSSRVGTRTKSCVIQ